MKAFSETPSKAIIFYSHFLHTGMSAASLLRLSGVQLFLPLNELENIWRSSRICPQILILLPFLLLSEGCFSHLGLDFQKESRGPGISRLGAETAIKLQRRAFWQRCSSVIFRRVTERLKKALGVDDDGDYLHELMRDVKIHTLVYDSCRGKEETTDKEEKQSGREIERHDEYVGHLINLSILFEKKTLSVNQL